MPLEAGAVAEVAEVVEAVVVAEELLLLQAVVHKTRRAGMHLKLHLQPQKRRRLRRTAPPLPPPLRQPRLPAPAQRNQQQGQQPRLEVAVPALASFSQGLFGGHNWTERRSRKRRRRNSRTRRRRMRA